MTPPEGDGAAVAPIEPVDADIDHPALNRVFDGFRDRGREVPLLYRMLGNAPAMLDAWVQMAWPLRSEPETDRGLRELLIMRTALLTRSSFEWQAHWPAAIRFGVTEAQLEALGEWESSPEFSAAERAALACAGEIILDGGASPGAVGRLREFFSAGECIELILTTSFYVCVARTLQSLGIEADATTAGPALDAYSRLIQ
ncbi:MAG: carboxymuconolactone decarboxylase family protein [Acidimicrobiaceae bacterium]|nr:carboxymuconolactone decarboxylase family protein [Acidimicrobiaceae bacterium]MYG98546.1 carboxymuconolactone decarboxylase family protein [Acidimicrobiaceae bacterium]MYH00637.1 carboxymuconolactone decarboxylase family protein [Acidimicrobiaceae bacterium]MYL02921.1 carboxymuconolactone decarboxylase family protein [Acidimicrobiaceae bacterium]